jgi:hypothetical protein
MEPPARFFRFVLADAVAAINYNSPVRPEFVVHSGLAIPVATDAYFARIDCADC